MYPPFLQMRLVSRITFILSSEDGTWGQKPEQRRKHNLQYRINSWHQQLMHLN